MRVGATAWIIAACSLAATGCVSRVIHELGVCGDGQFVPGDICFSADGRVERYRTEDLTAISIRGADFTGDDVIDVLVMGSEASGVVGGRTFIGNGDGTLRDPVDAKLFGCSAHPVPGLVDHETPVDLLVDECSDSVSLFTGTSAGAFAGPQSVFVGARTRSSALVDLTGDGETEVVVLGTAPDESAVLSVSFPSGGEPVTIGVSDIGGSPFDPVGFGIADLDSEDALVVLIDPTIVGGLAIMSHPLRREAAARLEVDFTPAGAAVADFDNDGEDELLVAAPEHGALITLEIDEPGADPVEVGRTEADLSPLARQIVDIDLDDKIDLVTSSADSHELAIWRGRGDGTFEDAVHVDVGMVPEQFFVADLNGDTAPDLVSGNFTENEIVVLIADP